MNGYSYRTEQKGGKDYIVGWSRDGGPFAEPVDLEKPYQYILEDGRAVLDPLPPTAEEEAAATERRVRAAILEQLPEFLEQYGSAAMKTAIAQIRQSEGAKRP